MNSKIRLSIFLLRVSLGGMFFYAGLSKIINPAWTAAAYIGSAKTFPGLYQWLALPQNMGWVNFLNEWGILLLGAALILGFFTRAACVSGILVMALYYFPILQFPYVAQNSFIIDQHIIFILVFLLLIFAKAGWIWGADGAIKKQKLITKP